MRSWLTEELENVSCDYCGSTELCREFTRADKMRVVECARCGLAYLNPRPRPDFIARLYEADYFTGALAGRGEGGLWCDVEPSTSRVSADKKNVPRPVAIINEMFGGLLNKDVLEIGCATGDLLSRMQKEGARVKGLEISDYAADIARKRGSDVTTGTIEDYVVADRLRFDVVMAFEVIEHVLSPKRFLDHVASLLDKGGLFILSTPNYSCVNRHGDQWFGFRTSFEHIYFFSVEVLMRMAAKSGLVLKYWETSFGTGGNSGGGFLRRQIERSYIFSVFSKEFGVPRAIHLFLDKSARYQPFGSGHTLMAVFEKL
jgi:2-polyprenyl-3-methyl-5-hydroxy-6-metoxy-1,4-benzoquinol methylase